MLFIECPLLVKIDQDLGTSVRVCPPNPPSLGGIGVIRQSPPSLGGIDVVRQSPPELGDLGGDPGFMKEVYCTALATSPTLNPEPDTILPVE